MKTLACINVSYSHEKNIYEIFDCCLQCKDGKNVSLNLFTNRQFYTFRDMYLSILKSARANGFKVPKYNDFNSVWYAVNFINVFENAPRFLQFAIRKADE